MKVNKIKNIIIFFLALIFFIFIVNTKSCEARALSKISDLFSGEKEHLGDTITLSYNGEGTDDSLEGHPYSYCFQRALSCVKSTYKVRAYIVLDGYWATRYYNNGDRDKGAAGYSVYSSCNMALGYIFGNGEYAKGFTNSEGIRTASQVALWGYGDTWMSNVGNQLFSDRWTVEDLSDPYEERQKRANFEETVKARNYANAGDIPTPTVSFDGSSIKEYNNTQNGEILGPFKVNFNSNRIHITSISVKDNYGNEISNGISFYLNKNGTNSVSANNITQNQEFYIKNTTNRIVDSITVNVETDIIYRVEMWFLHCYEETSQELLAVKPSSYRKYASTTLKIKSTGSLYITKSDTETQEQLNGAGFKIYKNGSGWQQGNTAPYSYVEDINQATEYTMDNNNKTGYVQYIKYDGSSNSYKGKNVLKISGLKNGVYHVYETKSPTANPIEKYKLELQKGYNKTLKCVDTGFEAKIGKNTSNGYSWEQVLGISNIQIISISGYVWKDLVPESKLTDTNNLWDTNEERISGVTVRLMKKGNPPTEVATTTTGNDGSYVFKDLISRYSLKNHYIEFNYNGTNYKKYIPVAFGATSTNGSKAIVQNMPEYDRDFEGIATTYTGTNDATKESQYGLEKCGTFNANARTLENINLGIKEVPKPEYDIRENIATVKITMKGFTYTYVYGGERGESRIYAPQVTYQNKNDITAYRHSFYPTDIAYDKTKNTEELKAEVKYRIDVKNTENMNLESTYKEETMYLKQLVNDFDVNRYTLEDDNWTAGQVTTDSNGNKKQTATIKENYLNTIYDQTLGIVPENKITAYINFSVNHDAILDILNHPDGIAEGFPTEAAATAYHKYTRNDYSWDNNILKGQTHYTEDDERKAQAPYLIFTLGKDRTINGKVFEDKVVTDNGEKLGNGTNEQGESAVKGVKVELLDATKDEIADVTKLSVSNLYTVDVQDSAPLKEVSKTAIVDTDENGNYTLKGVVPGYYILRYTYGDGTQEYTDSNGNKISVDVESKIRNTDGQEKTVYAKDYKSTIVTSQVAKNALENSNENTYTWYRKLEGENYSVAIDSLNERKALNNDKENNIIDDSKENTKENEKVIIDAGTAKMYLGIENNKDDKETEDVEVEDNVQKEEYKNEINGINFGIIEQPIQQAKVEKVITYVTLTNSQNNVVFDGNPENAKMQGVSDLDNQQNGGSIYVRAEVLEDIIYSSKLELDYEIRVTNVSDVNYYEDNYYLYGDKNGAHEITLKVNEVTDYLDETLKYLPEKSDKDRVSTEIKSMKLDDRNVQVLKLNKWDDVLFTNKLNDNSRKTTDKVTIVAERILSREDKDMEIINEAEITGIKHATETGNTEEEKLKIAPSEVHTNGRVKVVTSITPPTGENKQLGVYYAIAGIVTLVLLSAGIVIIKKKIK